MKITKNHVYVALLAVAASAWCVDRFVLDGGVTGPAPAAAALLVNPAAPPSAAVLASPAEKPLTLAARFQNAMLADDADHDAFAPPAAWLAREKPAAAATSPASLQAAFDVAGFQKSHKLTAVLRTGPSVGVAVIDGKMVQIGNSFDGLVLVGLTQTSATLRGQGIEFSLQIDATSGRGTLSPSSAQSASH